MWLLGSFPKHNRSESLPGYLLKFQFKCFEIQLLKSQLLCFLFKNMYICQGSIPGKFVTVGFQIVSCQNFQEMYSCRGRSRYFHKRGGLFFLNRKKSKYRGCNSNRKLQNMVKRKMTRMNWKYCVKTRFYQSITQLKKGGARDPPMCCQLPCQKIICLKVFHVNYCSQNLNILKSNCDMPHKGNNKITELRTILQKESQNS